MEPFYLLHFTYGMDYTRKGKFTPGKYGEWRFDKRTYAQLPPPRHLSEPPRGMKNALVIHMHWKPEDGGPAASFHVHPDCASICACVIRDSVIGGLGTRRYGTWYTLSMRCRPSYQAGTVRTLLL